MDTGCHPTGGISHASTEPPTDSRNVPLVANTAAHNNVPPVTDTDVPPAANINVPPAANIRVTTDANTELVIEAKPTAASSVVTTSPPLVLPINMGSIPPFLLSHRIGKRAVNIFQYLNEAEHAHFQQVLSYYICFVTLYDQTTSQDQSMDRGSLPCRHPSIHKGEPDLLQFHGLYPCLVEFPSALLEIIQTWPSFS